MYVYIQWVGTLTVRLHSFSSFGFVIPWWAGLSEFQFAGTSIVAFWPSFKWCLSIHMSPVTLIFIDIDFTPSLLSRVLLCWKKDCYFVEVDGKFSCIPSAVKLDGVTKAVLSFNLWKPQQCVLSSIRGTCIWRVFLWFLIVKVNDTVNASLHELKLSWCLRVTLINWYSFKAWEWQANFL